MIFYEGEKQEFIKQSLSVITHNISEITSNGKYFKQISCHSMGLVCFCMALVFLVSTTVALQHISWLYKREIRVGEKKGY